MGTIVKNINPNNDALKFIDKRISDENYRGSWSSQHNRYKRKQIVIILSLLDKYVPNKTLMAIRTTDISTDISKRSNNNNPEEKWYAKFCNEAKQQTGIGTQDAMRKNIFVDLHRMKFIERYDKDKKSIDPFSRKKIKYVSLTNVGLRLIKAKDLKAEAYIFAKGINNLLGSYIDTIFDLLQNYTLKFISIYEFMFFVSAVGIGASFTINISKCVELIRKYRTLSSKQRKEVITTLKSRLNPENYLGDKKSKRDFHNWHNQAQQVFSILQQLPYFEVSKSQDLSLRQLAGQPGQPPPKRLKRSPSQRHKYFDEHKVKKRKKGFELHHVVPLAWSEDEEHFNQLDTWENMVYIDVVNHTKIHTQITQNRNRNVVMTVSGNDVILSGNDVVLKDRCDHVYLKNDENILYAVHKQKIMLDYNAKLLDIVHEQDKA